MPMIKYLPGGAIQSDITEEAKEITLQLLSIIKGSPELAFEIGNMLVGYAENQARTPINIQEKTS